MNSSQEHTIVMLQSKEQSKSKRKGNIDLFDDKLYYTEKDDDIMGRGGAVQQHLYVLSDDQIKEGDHAFYKNLGEIMKVDKGEIFEYPKQQKIIATSDQSLGLPQIPQNFIKEYCEKDGIDKVRVEYEQYDNGMSTLDISDDLPYEYPTRLKVTSDNTINIIC